MDGAREGGAHDEGRSYLCIDLKSFYASVECVERGLDPMTTDLVVADPERTDKTICLAVSPSLKAKGVRNRCRVFEIPEAFDYLMAPPRMALYIEYSANIYAILLRYIAKEDIHVYSIDESFIDVTSYLPYYHTDAIELGERIREDIVAQTGIPATCGVGPNLFLAKVALDIPAKRSPDFFGVLDEGRYRATLWNHTPITDFWRVGAGTARRLHDLGIDTMGQLALYPDRDRLYNIFGVDAEILIDHAWGIEPVTMDDIKAYRPHSKSLTNAQVLSRPYAYEDARTVVKEMCDASATDMVAQGLTADSLTLGVRYDRNERGLMLDDGGTSRLSCPTNSRRVLIDAAMDVFGHRVDPRRSIRYLMITFNGIADEDRTQPGLFHAANVQEERRRQEAVVGIQRKYGKNSLFKGIDLLECATQRERNGQIGGHRSGA